jgi:hypothetical protein
MVPELGFEGKGLRATVLCEECRRLLDAFADAVHAVAVLSQKHLAAVMDGESDPQRFDLLIRDANETKQHAKYAYVHHQESHDCSSTHEEQNTKANGSGD